MTRAIPSVEPRGLNRDEAAAYVGVGVTLFDAMVKDGRMPKPARVNGRVLWDRRQVDRAMDRLFDEPLADERRWTDTAA